MKKVKFLIVFLFYITFYSCQINMPSWIEDSNHALSPDGKVAIYESRFNGNRISIATWANSIFGAGGVGVFDIEVDHSSDIKLSWISESTALIEYPSDAEIIRQKDSAYFAGRTILLEYKVSN